MIISSEHHDLIEEFKSANEVEGEAIKALHAYMASPGAEKAVIMQLSRQFEEAHDKKMEIYSKLKKLDMSQN